MRRVSSLFLLCATTTLAAAQPPSRAGVGEPGPPSSVAVSGIVLDQTSAVLAAATVDLVNASGAVIQTTAAGAGGAFRFERVAPGQYELRAWYEGFKAAIANVRVGTRPPAPQKLVLGLADLKQEITVSNATAEVGATSGNNVDAITIDQNMLESLPVFDNDFVATMSQFLDGWICSTTDAGGRGRWACRATASRPQASRRSTFAPHATSSSAPARRHAKSPSGSTPSTC